MREEQKTEDRSGAINKDEVMECVNMEVRDGTVPDRSRMEEDTDRVPASSSRQLFASAAQRFFSAAQYVSAMSGLWNSQQSRTRTGYV